MTDSTSTTEAAGRTPIVAQLGGAALCAAGVYLLAGLAWSLLIAGVCLVAWGAAREGGWL